MAYSTEVVHWGLMVAAMMLPFQMEAIRDTAEKSFWRRRDRAITGVLCGFAVPWLGLGLVVAAALRGLPVAHLGGAASLAFGLAALWLLTPAYARALAACHRRLPLAPMGWRADRDALRLGAVLGAGCVASCWPMMVACAFTGHSVVALAGGFAAGVAERGAFRPRRRVTILLTLGLMAWSLAAAQPAPAPGVAGSTRRAFSLGREAERVSLSVRIPEQARRLVLRIEGITATEPPPAYTVYLNVPAGVEPASRPDLRVGVLPLYGVVETTATRRRPPNEGLSYLFPVTELIRRLSAEQKEPLRTLRLTFVPAPGSGSARVKVGRAVLLWFRDPRG